VEGERPPEQRDNGQFRNINFSPNFRAKLAARISRGNTPPTAAGSSFGKNFLISASEANFGFTFGGILARETRNLMRKASVTIFIGFRLILLLVVSSASMELKPSRVLQQVDDDVEEGAERFTSPKLPLLLVVSNILCCAIISTIAIAFGRGKRAENESSSGKVASA
jgi:hypothetical protein